MTNIMERMARLEFDMETKEQTISTMRDEMKAKNEMVAIMKEDIEAMKESLEAKDVEIKTLDPGAHHMVSSVPGEKESGLPTTPSS